MSLANNALLLALQAKDLAAISERLKPMPLDTSQMLGEPGAPIEQVIFPTSGLVSIVTEL